MRGFLHLQTEPLPTQGWHEAYYKRKGDFFLIKKIKNKEKSGSSHRGSVVNKPDWYP